MTPTPQLEIIIILEDGTEHVCIPPLYQETEKTEAGHVPKGPPRVATEQELALILITQTLSKPQPCGFQLASGGSVILGPMVASKAQYLIVPVKDGPIAAMPEPEPEPEPEPGTTIGDN